MEDNSIFRIPMGNSVADVQAANVNAVEVSSAPYKINNQNESDCSEIFDLYSELTAISEEVMSCRNATLGRA